ncbi:ABC transporter ATP-binding protein [Calidifontibacillus erzurumensis]|uniref:ABC transporter ATP-binding protein n=1 Tax=Calidifontibacillus erzurumensis TaxID=2741433 RepID=A0A8J8GGS2_9BACI|nr:ABC transporter ATP-binding protein [Calidifontibacillus erzurumensis]NSL52040.1 ABC transporter ATP-binding protein [Calidifontibacillus erzurumensis]
MHEYSIEVNDISKVYKIYNKSSDRLKETLHPLRKKYHTTFTALDNITFRVKKGETLGIIGRNGSGKSTLLKIITGIITPTSGVIHKRGKVAALLELGAGFNPELTGIENIYLNGTLMGISKEEMETRLESIISFADIGEFINQPVKMYSSGMFARLAFAVAIHVDPDILIVDEALAVGDLKFQSKCFNRFKDLKDKGITILFVGHDVISIRNFCDRVMWINDGKIVRIGDTVSVTADFMEFMKGDKNTLETEKVLTEVNEVSEASFTHKNNFIIDDSINHWGSHIGLIKGIRILNNHGIDKEVFEIGEKIQIKILFTIPENIDLDYLSVAFSIKNKLGIDILVSTTYDKGKIKFTKNGCEAIVTFEFTNYLKDGDYILVVAIENRQDPSINYFEYIEGARYFKVYSKESIFGLVNIPVDQDLQLLEEHV